MSNDKDFKVKNGIQPTAYHEAVGTVVSGSEPYSFSGASYDSVSFSVAVQDTFPTGIFFKPDGTKMYVVGTSGDSVYEYNLSTAWDITTASFLQLFSVAAQDTFPYGLFFKPDGTKMYVLGLAGDDVNEYNLSTPWDVSTASFLQLFSLAAQDTTPTGLFFKPDGTKMYVVGSTGDAAYEYDLSTPWDVSTAVFNQLFSVSAQDTSPNGLFFKPDGTKMYVVGQESDNVNEYNLSTPWDITTASFLQTFSVTGQDIFPWGLFFKPDGTKMYITGTIGDAVYQYSTTLTTASLDLSTGSVFEITPTSDLQVSLTNPAASGTSSGATLLLDQAGYGGYDIGNAVYDGVSFDVEGSFAGPLYFKSDGLTFYVMNVGSAVAYQHSMSTAWDLSTASYASKSHDFSPENGFTGRGFWLKPDGTKLYSVDASGSNIAQYSLSTAWDLSTTTYDSISFSYTSQLTGGYDVTFSEDGTSMYILDLTTLYQYTLSTAWDISTASYASKSFSLSPQDNSALAVYFKTGGTTMYINGSFSGAILQYTLSTAWDISTASYDNVSFNIASQESDPFGLAFKSDDGAKVYYAGTGGFVYQASALTPATITYDPILQWSGGTAPTAPTIGETDVLTFNTTDGGTTYKSALAIDGAV